MRISDWSSDVCSSDLSAARSNSHRPIGRWNRKAAAAATATISSAKSARRLPLVIRHPPPVFSIMRRGRALDKPGCSAQPVSVHVDEGCERQLTVYVNVSDRYMGGLAQGRIVNGHGVQPRRPRLPDGGAQLHRRKLPRRAARQAGRGRRTRQGGFPRLAQDSLQEGLGRTGLAGRIWRHRRSEEHTSELQSLMRISYAVFCLKKKKETHTRNKYM